MLQHASISLYRSIHPVGGSASDRPIVWRVTATTWSVGEQSTSAVVADGSFKTFSTQRRQVIIEVCEEVVRSLDTSAKGLQHRDADS